MSDPVVLLPVAALDPAVALRYEWPRFVETRREQRRRGGVRSAMLHVQHLTKRYDALTGADATAVLTDTRHLDEIFFDTLQVFRFCIHDSLKPYAICCKSY
ncbi:MAG TPA: hypothetical protein VK679_16325, partial [Gemmatimonadaceae bacterium]|nr:hypothetical protein [Gemmatimonadaceae bacterium]